MAELQKGDQDTAVPAASPGEVISPAGAVVNNAPPVPIYPPDTEPQPQATPAPPEKTVSEPETSLFKSASPETDANTPSITWSSSEFHMHEKSSVWYLGLAIATVVVAIALYLLTRSIVTPVVVIACGIIFGVYGTHRPDQLDYMMNNKGIRIGTKQYPYDDFQLFIITPSSPSPEVTLIPVKRFMPPLSVRYVPDLEEKILNMLSDHLPLEERAPDMIDSFMRRIHF